MGWVSRCVACQLSLVREFPNIRMFLASRIKSPSALPLRNSQQFRNRLFAKWPQLDSGFFRCAHRD